MEKPTICPKCKSPYWDKERERGSRRRGGVVRDGRESPAPKSSMVGWDAEIDRWDAEIDRWDAEGSPMGRRHSAGRLGVRWDAGEGREWASAALACPAP